MPSEQSVPARAAPPFRFKNDVELPISARREEILAALDRHQVLIVAGDTGSGKSTLELGLWIEEYRVSLYAQELKTLGPISAARLEQRATDIEAWIAR